MESFFLGCFLFGALFTGLSAVLGALGPVLHLPAFLGHSHPPHRGSHPASGHAAGTGPASAPGWAAGLRQHLASLLNFSALVAFLTWFGATGYLLLRFAALPLWAKLTAAVLAGWLGGTLISFFVRKVMAGDQVLDPAEYRLVGTLAKVTITIPTGGVGTIVFTKARARRSEAARGLEGQALARGAEVVITSYEHGVATVEPWADLLEGVQSRRMARAGTDRKG